MALTTLPCATALAYDRDAVKLSSSDRYVMRPIVSQSNEVRVSFDGIKDALGRVGIVVSALDSGPGERGSNLGACSSDA
jgi:hypothetical protein